MRRVAVPPIHPSGNRGVKREGDLAGGKTYGARHFRRIAPGKPRRRGGSAKRMPGPIHMHARTDAPDLSGTTSDFIAKRESLMRGAQRNTPRRQGRDAERRDRQPRPAVGAGQPLIRFIPAHGGSQHRSSTCLRKASGTSRQANCARHGKRKRIGKAARCGMTQPRDHAAKTIQQQQARGLRDPTLRPIPGEGDYIAEITFRACGHR